MDKAQKIAKAFTGDGQSTLVHLNTAQADKFIDYVVDESVILKSSRVVRMDTPSKVIGKIGISDKILYPAQRGQALDTNKRTEATPDKITLTSQEVIGEVRIYDDEIEDNIEGVAFKEHMMKMIAKKVSNQLERVGLYSRKVANPADLLQMFDGFVKAVETAGVVVDASNTVLFADRYIDKEKLAKLRKSIDTKYRNVLNKWYMPDDVAIDYEVKYEASNNTVNKYGAFGVDFTKANIMSIDRPVFKTGGLNTTLTASPVAGAVNITVASTTNATAGDVVTLALGQDKEFSTTIDTVTDATHLVLTDAIPFGYNHTLSTENTVKETTLDGADVLLTPDYNFIYGIQRDITIEPDRVPKERATDFVITMRLDFQVENAEMTGILKNVKVK